MRTYLARGALTDQIIEVLEAILVIGDGVVPEAGGWDDNPNAPTSTFTPYAVLSPQTTTEGNGSFGDSNSEYRVPYAYSVYATSREQVEFYADKVRKVFVDLSRTVVVLGDFSWKIQQARVNSIGGVARSDTVEPSEFTQTDVVTLYISKEM